MKIFETVKFALNLGNTAALERTTYTRYMPCIQLPIHEARASLAHSSISFLSHRRTRVAAAKPTAAL